MYFMSEPGDDRRDFMSPPGTNRFRFFSETLQNENYETESEYSFSGGTYKRIED